MKSPHLLASVLVLVGTLLHAQEMPVSLEALDQARAERGLPPFIRLEVLDQEAREFMWYNLKNGVISHDAAPEPDKNMLHGIYLADLEFTTGVSHRNFEVWELLAQCTCGFTDRSIAHVFDDSPLHASIYYNPRTLWVGYCLFVRAGYWMYVLYAVTMNEEADIDELRRLPF